MTSQVSANLGLRTTKISGSSGKRVPGRFAREASFFDVEEREEAVAPSSTAAQKNRFCGSSVKHEPVLLGQGVLGLTLTINDVKCW
ncbi:MAG: hypothetical protein ACLP2X_06735 [Syntrophobacteraceae bacterium]